MALKPSSGSARALKMKLQGIEPSHTTLEMNATWITRRLAMPAPVRAAWRRRQLITRNPSPRPLRCRVIPDRERAHRRRLNLTINGGSVMFNSARKSLTFAAAIVSLAALAGTASAETSWQKAHPRRTQVNHRLSNQNRRIHNDVKDGTMSKAQAAQAHHEDHQVRQEERDMASQNGGHITKAEQGVLNRQENGISNQIPPK
jgi:outer membrane murein-binding lipoprotein Lpp